MKTLTFLAASALALTTAACQRAEPLNAKLDCPTAQGGLTRVSAAPDGQSCVYREADGAQVTLSRMPLKGDVRATLATLEAELKALGGTPTGAPSAGPSSAADAGPGAAAEAARVEAEARADAKLDTTISATLRDKTDTKSARFQAKFEDSGDETEHTRVDLPGLHIVVDGEKADVNVGPIHVDADGDNSTATIKIYREVRLRGEALSRVKRGVRATFIYAGDDLSGGYKYLGYEAAGPRTGPLTVAVVKSQSGSDQHSDMYDDVKRLVRRNGGV